MQLKSEGVEYYFVHVLKISIVASKVKAQQSMLHHILR